MLGDAKRRAETIWVLRHAMVCSEAACPVAGCFAAKQVLRVMEEQEKEAVGDLAEYPELSRAVDAAREALHHRATCPSALGGGKDRLPCVVCALVARARPVKQGDGASVLKLDFSKRHDRPSFALPGAKGTEKPAPEPDLRRSSTTEELALLLSDLSRGGGAGEGGKKNKTDAAAGKDDDAPMPMGGAKKKKKSETTTTTPQKRKDPQQQQQQPPKGAKEKEKEKNEKEEPRAFSPSSARAPSSSTTTPSSSSSRRRRPSPEEDRPQRRSTRLPSRYRDDDADDEEKDDADAQGETKNDMAPPPPRKKVKVVIDADPPKRVRIESPRLESARLSSGIPRSPSFNAAASSLLALTRNTTSGSFSPASGPPLLMPQC
eukprot:CAMPEP_0118905672 /NCGR_PEP_ID=MMETSP1166-20130328/9563_1 /TAXON_ID=1104430 /ORGANISM="Chrysoreinhardia sp, Strain CCMP3193" /LENGTH=374 /DNA_ID=CAMNT_0006844943 /DNA_START=53 /DNA_END=1177 /DNA_ORIENTATION=+